MKAIVTGMIGTYPVGGVAWDYGQYALGLERLGIEVTYLEDTGWKSYDPRVGDYTDDPRYGVAFLQQSLEGLSPTLGRRWHFRAMSDSTYGISPDDLEEALDSADLFVNVSGGTVLRPRYERCRNKVMIDTDPGWNHFRNWPQWRKKEDWPESAPFTAHDHFFTYAERIGTVGCLLPDFGLPWHPTRPPVVLDEWAPEPPGKTWTTVMTWKNFQESIEYDGAVYGTKEMEFEKVEQLPSRVEAHLEVAAGGAAPPAAEWRELGWSVQRSEDVSRTSDEYRSYIQRSRGEFSVAKNVYVATQSGWFSCRSVCYLAAGRPVVVQDTGFRSLVPVGEGLLAFSDLAEAVAGINAVEGDYERHAVAARHVAEDAFASDRVLADLVDRVVG